MLDEELPNHSGDADLTGWVPNDPFRQELATWPGMTSTLNGIENHFRVVSAVRISETRDARRDSSVDRVSSTLVSPRHTGGQFRMFGNSPGAEPPFNFGIQVELASAAEAADSIGTNRSVRGIYPFTATGCGCFEFQVKLPS
jgi:hypothetical protein